MIVGLVDNEYPSGSSMSASVIICIVLLGLIPEIEPTLFGFSPANPNRGDPTKRNF
jgi:thiamine transporter ThiT